MLARTVLSGLASLATVFGMPLDTPVASAGLLAPRQADLSFQVHRFGVGCSPGGCITRVIVSAPAGYLLGAPAFNATCQATGATLDWVQCDQAGAEGEGSTVLFRHTHPNYSDWHLWISHQFSSLGLSFNVTAYSPATIYAPGYETFAMPVQTVQAS